MKHKNEIEALAMDAGFHAARLVSVKSLMITFNRFLPQKTAADAISSIASYFGETIIRTPADWSILVCGLSYYRSEPQYPDNTINEDQYGLIAPFARRNYYRDAHDRLKSIYHEIKGSTFKRSDFKAFSNSRLDEKLLAWGSGLGSFGRNSLIKNDALGSSFVIAGMLIDVLTEHTPIELPVIGESCGDCTACIDSCPIHAIRSGGRIDRKLCFQSRATRLSEIRPDELDRWGYSIYGCTYCQDVCPFNQKLSLFSDTKLGEIGPALALSPLLASSPSDLKRSWRGTALGLSWIDPVAIQRNALIVSGNRKNPGLLPLIETYLTHESEHMRAIAKWALQKTRYG
jgi:epoxyqueuosine reductase